MKDRKFPYLLIAPATLFVAIMLLYPIVMNIGYSFRDMGFFSGGSQKFIGLQNYLEVIGNPAFGIAFRNTILFTFASVFLQFLISLPLSLLFNQNLPGQNVARGLALVPWMIPHVVAALAWVWMMDGQLG
ncbi:sugar ABC transporter permease, partial [bacterium]